MNWTEKKHVFYLSIAEAVSKHSPCLKGNFGAVVVKDDIIVGTGYNGPARQVKHCEKCYRDGYASGEGYDKCVAVHAEVNAIVQSGGRQVCNGATMYVASHNRHFDDNISYHFNLGWFPCNNCARVIVNAGIEWVVVPGKEKTKPRVFHIPTLVKQRLIE